MKKTARMLIRLTDDDKASLRLAAQAKRKTVSRFVLGAALAAATTMNDQKQKVGNKGGSK